MGDKSIVFEIHKAIFKNKIEVFRKYAEELEGKFESDLKVIESRFDFDFEDDEGDEDYASYVEFLIDEKRMVEQDFLNQYRSSAIISVNSLIEHRLRVIAELLGKLKSSKLEVSDLSGEGIIRNRNYLEKVCGVDFSHLNKQWSVIKDLSALRNCVVHCEGDITKARASQKLSNIVENTEGLRLERDDTIVFELPYLEKVIDVAEDFFSGVVDAAFEVFSSYNKSSQKDALKRASA